MTERRENIARAREEIMRALSADGTWRLHSNPESMVDEFLAGVPTVAAAIAADDGAIGRVLALAERYETNAKYLRGLGQGGPTTAALECAAEDIHAAVGATVAADGPAISRVLALAERWGRDLSPHWQEAGRKLTAAVGAPATAEDGEL